jgi:hypothetical protein
VFFFQVSEQMTDALGDALVRTFCLLCGALFVVWRVETWSLQKWTDEGNMTDVAAVWALHALDPESNDGVIRVRVHENIAQNYVLELHKSEDRCATCLLIYYYTGFGQITFGDLYTETNKTGEVTRYVPPAKPECRCTTALVDPCCFEVVFGSHESPRSGACEVCMLVTFTGVAPGRYVIAHRMDEQNRTRFTHTHPFAVRAIYDKPIAPALREEETAFIRDEVPWLIANIPQVPRRGTDDQYVIPTETSSVKPHDADSWWAAIDRGLCWMAGMLYAFISLLEGMAHVIAVIFCANCRNQ